MSSVAKRKKYTPEERARKGGFARAKALTKRQIQEIGRKGAIIRWERARALREAQVDPFQKPAA